VHAVGQQAYLGPGQADGLMPGLVDGHGHQGDGDLLTGGDQHVQLALGRVAGDLVG